MKTSKQLQLELLSKNHGYFLARSLAGDVKTKLKVEHSGSALYYDLNCDRQFETIPLQLGNGRYTATLYKQVIGRKYTAAGRIEFNVCIKNEKEVYTHYNQYVQENSDLAWAVRGLYADGDERRTYLNVKSFIKSNFAYDYVKAVLAKDSVLPDIDACYRQKMGLCQDLAALTASIFRSLNIPAKLVIGYADGRYHAWASVLVCGAWVLCDPTVIINGIRKPREYIVERWY